MEELSALERLAANTICRHMLETWHEQREPCDMVELVALLSQGAARACRQVQLNKPPPAA